MEHKLKSAKYYDIGGIEYTYYDVYFSNGYFYTKNTNRQIVKIKFRAEDVEEFLRFMG